MATLVARGASSTAVCEAVAEEVAQVMHLPMVAVCRYEDDGEMVAVLAEWSDRPHVFQPGTRWPIDGPSVDARVLQTGRPATIEDYEDLPGAIAAGARESGLNRTAGAPIIVGGSIWGVMGIASPDGPLPEHVGERLAQFTELVGTAIANGQAHDELTRLADEQAALRRVAILAAKGAPPVEVFEAVSKEVAGLFRADAGAVMRYEADGTLTAAGGWTASEGHAPTGMRFTLEGSVSGLILETGCPSRIDSFDAVPGETAAALRDMGWRTAAGAPISVEGRLWGTIVVYSVSAEPFSFGTEERLATFGEIVATAIANTESRAELDASRARIVATADATRRRIERDLHDGAQQQLVSLALELRGVEEAVPPELRELREGISRSVERVTSVLDELREVSLGIHPAILAEGGLGPALRTLARRAPMPVELDVRTEGRLPESVEVTAYYVVSEALTNAAKYARASVVDVAVELRRHLLRVRVRDDGLGGADPARGSGLLGLKDRAEAIGGTLSLHSPHGRGTSLVVELPLEDTSMAERRQARHAVRPV